MSEPRVRFLGTGDAFGSGGRLQACLLLEGAGDGEPAGAAGDGGAVLIDCGATTLVAMKRAGVDPGRVGTLLLSHLHGDHFGGLPFMILDAQFSRRTRGLVVAGPPGVKARVDAAMEVFFPGSSRAPQRFALEFVELQEGPLRRVGPAEVTAFPVIHASGAPAFALRVRYGGKVLAYSGDTEWTDALLEAARDADLFVCEAYFFDKKVRYHLDYATLSAHRARLGCRRLLLTHMSAEMLGRAREADVECAEDGLVVSL